jgi:hypothetical protein
VTFVGCHGQCGGKGQGRSINGMAIFDSFGPTHCPSAQMLKLIPLLHYCQHFIWIKCWTKMTIIQSKMRQHVSITIAWQIDPFGQTLSTWLKISNLSDDEDNNNNNKDMDPNPTTIIQSKMDILIFPIRSKQN